MRNFVIPFILSIYSLSGAANILVPSKTIPRNFSPIQAYDVFSMHVVRQVHGTLFRVNKNNIPEKFLVEEFHLTPDKSRYVFKLKASKFHDGSPLRAAHVKRSIENALKEKFFGFERLKCIQGYQNFVSKKVKRLSGIKIKGPLDFEIHLTCPSPQLIFTLADLRLSITKGKNFKVGLGHSKIQSASKSEITLSLVADKNQKFTIKKYEKDREPIDWVRENKNVAFLLSKPYELSDKTLKLNKTPAYSLKNYVVALNSRSLTKEAHRRFISKSIDRNLLIKNCFKSEKASNQIVPFGFPGYSKKGDLSLDLNGPSNAPTKKLNVVIFKGIGNEKCVEKNLNTMFSKKGLNATIRHLNSDKGIGGFLEGQFDLAFLYLEAELSMDMLQFYVNADGFSLGDVSDKSLFQKYTQLRKLNPGVFFQEAPKLAQKALNQLTVLPLFIPKEYIITTSKIDRISAGVYSPTFIDYSAIRLKK